MKCLSLICLLLVATSVAAQSDLDMIRKNITNFSQAYMSADYDAIANAYTEDGRILPPGPQIIQGREDIRARWVVPEGVKILHHAIKPEEIKIIGEYAYDVGYYEGRTLRSDQTEVSWQGKYLIVWQKVDGDWKIHLDAWNQVR